MRPDLEHIAIFTFVISWPGFNVEDTPCPASFWLVYIDILACDWVRHKSWSGVHNPVTKLFRDLLMSHLRYSKERDRDNVIHLHLESCPFSC